MPRHRQGTAASSPRRPRRRVRPSLPSMMGLEMLLEVGGLGARNLGGDAQRHSGGARNADGIFRPFLHRQTAEKGKVRSPFVRWTKQVDGQSMLDGVEPGRIRKRQPLVVRYRHEGSLGKFTDDIGQSRQIEPTVHGRKKRHAKPAEQREWQASRYASGSRRILPPVWRPPQAARRRRNWDPLPSARGAAPWATRGEASPLVRESPLANSVTSWPNSTSSSTSQATTRSVPP